MLKSLKIFINSKEIPESLYSQFTMIGDIEEIYNVGGLVLNDTSGTATDMSIFKIGDPVSFVFTFDTGNLVTVDYSILSIVSGDEPKTAGALDTVGDRYIIKLINPSFFNQTPANRGYYQNTSATVRAEMDKIKSNFKKVTIENSDDIKSRRYLLNERPMSFIKQISKKCTIGTEAVLCFTDEKGNFFFTSFKNLKSASPKRSLKHMGSKAKTNYPDLLMTYSSVKNFEDPVQSWDSLKIMSNIFNPAKNITTVSSRVGFGNTGSVIMDKSKISSLPFTIQVANPLEGFQEQKALYAKEVEKQIYNYTINVVVSNSIEDISCGDTVELSLTSSTKDDVNSTYSGVYLIKRCEHSLVDGNIVTKLTLISPSQKMPNWYNSDTIIGIS